MRFAVRRGRSQFKCLASSLDHGTGPYCTLTFSKDKRSIAPQTCNEYYVESTGKTPLSWNRLYGRLSTIICPRPPLLAHTANGWGRSGHPVMQLRTALNSYPDDILSKLQRQRIPCASFPLLSPPQHMVKIDTWREDVCLIKVSKTNNTLRDLPSPLSLPLLSSPQHMIINTYLASC